ncbi:MAG: DUF3515 family protein [Streptosporangiales bacterium]|nr:DUF3515 family protein [Streptosporangiales bacterium]
MLTVAVLAAACGQTVSVPEPNPAPEAVRLCRALHERLPDRLDSERRRPTEPDSELVAAWGSPPVGLRCGVGRPAGLRPTSRLATVNGVDWLPEPESAPTRFTTVGRAVYVEVILPEEGLPAANVLVDLAAPIKATVPPRRDPG